MAEICEKILEEKWRDGELDSERSYSLFLRNQVKKEKKLALFVWALHWLLRQISAFFD